MCGQHIEFSSRCLLSRQELPLQIKLPKTLGRHRFTAVTEKSSPMGIELAVQEIQEDTNIIARTKLIFIILNDHKGRISSNVVPSN